MPFQCACNIIECICEQHPKLGACTNLVHLKGNHCFPCIHSRKPKSLVLPTYTVPCAVNPNLWFNHTNPSIQRQNKISESTQWAIVRHSITGADGDLRTNIYPSAEPRVEALKQKMNSTHTKLIFNQVEIIVRNFQTTNFFIDMQHALKRQTINKQPVIFLVAEEHRNQQDIERRERLAHAFWNFNEAPDLSYALVYERGLSPPNLAASEKAFNRSEKTIFTEESWTPKSALGGIARSELAIYSIRNRSSILATGVMNIFALLQNTATIMIFAGEEHCYALANILKDETNIHPTNIYFYKSASNL